MLGVVVKKVVILIISLPLISSYCLLLKIQECNEFNILLTSISLTLNGFLLL